MNRRDRQRENRKKGRKEGKAKRNQWKRIRLRKVGYVEMDDGTEER